jgi:hypothetical protein
MELSFEFWNKYVPHLENLYGKEIIRKIKADLNII